VIISIDGGTTNTRIALVDNGGVIDLVKISVGARDNAADFKKILGEEIKRFLEKNKVEKREISFVTASGMITSDAGLLNVARIIAPAGRTELSQSKKEMFFDEIFHLPVTFIPGIKMLGENLLDTDVMRGEETVVIAGSDPFRSAYEALLKDTDKKVITLKDDIAENLAAIGAYKIMVQ